MDPGYLESGSIGAATSVSDRYFASEHEPTLRILFDQFLQRVPEPQRSAVEMCVMKRVTYKEAAEWFTVHRGVRTDPKTVWRWAQRGTEMLAGMLQAASWASAVAPQIPEMNDETEG
jgi:DNA-directed RNA polymerase specialized sigma24 family protein